MHLFTKVSQYTACRCVLSLHSPPLFQLSGLYSSLCPFLLFPLSCCFPVKHFPHLNKNNFVPLSDVIDPIDPSLHPLSFIFCLWLSLIPFLFDSCLHLVSCPAHGSFSSPHSFFSLLLSLWQSCRGRLNNRWMARGDWFTLLDIRAPSHKLAPQC